MSDKHLRVLERKAVLENTKDAWQQYASKLQQVLGVIRTTPQSTVHLDKLYNKSVDEYVGDVIKEVEIEHYWTLLRGRLDKFALDKTWQGLRINLKMGKFSNFIIHYEYHYRVMYGDFYDRDISSFVIRATENNRLNPIVISYRSKYDILTKLENDEKNTHLHAIHKLLKFVVEGK